MYGGTDRICPACALCTVLIFLFPLTACPDSTGGCDTAWSHNEPVTQHSPMLMTTEKNGSLLTAHLSALFVATVWGLTFISSKVLLDQYTPLEICVYRHVLAVGGMFLLRPRLFSHGGGWRTELLFICAGVCGVSLYFLLENTAMQYTYASNVSLIVCTAPFFTGIAARLLLGEELYANFYIGFVIAITGIALISFNGASNLGLNPLGDLLTTCAAISWAFYTTCTNKLFKKGYPLFLATRRILFWGLVTAVMILPFQDAPVTLPHLTDMTTLANFAFLGILASLGCFVIWNRALNILGPVRCTAYVYFSPVVTVLAAVILIDEHLTPMSVSGMVLTLAGLLLSERHKSLFRRPGRSEKQGRQLDLQQQ